MGHMVSIKILFDYRGSLFLFFSTRYFFDSFVLHYTEFSCSFFTVSMADCFYGADQRRSMATNGLKQMSHIDMHDNDFSSYYTAKSGTPLIYKMQGARDDLSDLTMAITPRITPRIRTTASFNLFWHEDAHHLREDSTAFCEKYNIKQCLKYLDQVSV
jgi:hypothetical protein